MAEVKHNKLLTKIFILLNIETLRHFFLKTNDFFSLKKYIKQLSTFAFLKLSVYKKIPANLFLSLFMNTRALLHFRSVFVALEPSYSHLQCRYMNPHYCTSLLYKKIQLTIA